uniref:Uncharacterized protein n=1 Tax=Eimeria tenella TaxID=5802 RepID=H9B920_EIMTE|nr:hypothetical protein [Eimeria tenella]
MRFSTYRMMYRVATQHFGPTAQYRKLYQAPVHLAAVLPYTLTRTNPVTMRPEASGSLTSPLISSLFATAMKNASLVSPASELSAAVSAVHAPLATLGDLAFEMILPQMKFREHYHPYSRVN